MLSNWNDFLFSMIIDVLGHISNPIFRELPELNVYTVSGLYNY